MLDVTRSLVKTVDDVGAYLFQIYPHPRRGKVVGNAGGIEAVLPGESGLDLFKETNSTAVRWTGSRHPTFHGKLESRGADGVNSVRVARQSTPVVLNPRPGATKVVVRLSGREGVKGGGAHTSRDVVASVLASF